MIAARPEPRLDGGEAAYRSLTVPAAPEMEEARLRRYIAEQGFRPGERLPSEGDLTTALGCSRAVVREALHALEALGLLESRAGSGWYLRAFDVATAVRTVAHSLAFHPAAVLDLLAVRRSVEGDLAGDLAGRATVPQLAVLQDLVERMRWRAGRGESFRQEDSEFHRRIAAMSGNLVALTLVDLYCTLMDALYERGAPRPAPRAASQVAEAHAKILDAIRAGDGRAARRVLRTHHDEAKRRLAAWTKVLGEGGQDGERRAQGESAEGGEGLAPDALRLAVQAALFWPGPGRTGQDGEMTR